MLYQAPAGYLEIVDLILIRRQLLFQFPRRGGGLEKLGPSSPIRYCTCSLAASPGLVEGLPTCTREAPVRVLGVLP